VKLGGVLEILQADDGLGEKLLLIATVSLTIDRVCGRVVRVPGSRIWMYCVSCEVRTDLYICYEGESRPPLWSSDQSSWLQNGDVLCFL
jgi:hypothetical protein